MFLGRAKTNVKFIFLITKTELQSGFKIPKFNWTNLVKIVSKTERNSISLTELGRIILTDSLYDLEAFLHQALPDIADEIGVDFDSYNSDILRSKLINVCLWAIVKALEGDREDILNSVKNAYWSVFDEEKAAKIKDIFFYKCIDYNEAWDDDSGSDQAIFALTVLADLFFDGETNEDIIDIILFLQINSYIFEVMERAVKIRELLEPQINKS